VGPVPKTTTGVPLEEIEKALVLILYVDTHESQTKGLRCDSDQGRERRMEAHEATVVSDISVTQIFPFKLE
jgi:hypothetical protein